MKKVSLVERRAVLLHGAAFAAVGMGAYAGLGRPARAAGGPLQRVNIVSTSGPTSLVVGALMKKQGYLAEFGVDGNIVGVSDGTKALGALISGDSDIAVGTGFGQVLPAIEKGAKVKILAGASMLSDNALFSSRPDIKTVKDLVGRTVGIGALGSLQHQLITALLKKKGIDVNQVHFVNIGSNPDIFRAVVAGTVDAGPGDSSVYEQQEKYKVHALGDGVMWTELPEYTNQASYATERAISEKRDLLVRTLAAYAKLYRFIQGPDSQAAFREARAIGYGKDQPEEAEAQWKFYQKNKMLAVDLVLSEERVRFMQQLNLDTGVQSTLLPYAQITDMSLARDAVKLLG
jgi:ABC-type nitrate/sulfonate/bicarbonate transport system substrate-binding protein